MSTAKFLLEHFYYGRLVHGGEPQKEQRVLAMSPGISPDLAGQAISRVMPPPLPNVKEGAFALVRGKHRQIPFLLVQAQVGRAGQTTWHYIIFPTEILKTLGGNIQGMMTLIEDEIPVFEQLTNKLPPVELPQTTPPSVDDQIDAILELMTITQNRIPLIEPLLAGIVQGKQLIIQGAPENLAARAMFIAGLLALLPPSARFGVTFTTHSLPDTEIDSQIRFYSDALPPKETVVFNWSRAQVSNAPEIDSYSRFVISQLRLDTERVIQHNTVMAPIAGWRINQGDSLADALSYAAKRIRLEEALSNNQPVNKDDVAAILAVDTTLPEDMRILYAGHLIKFSLAMEDMANTAPVASLLRDHRELEQVVFRQMDDAIKDGKAWLVYDALVDWLSHPDGPTNTQWVGLTHTAALNFLQILVEEEDAEEINNVLADMHQSPAKMAVGRIVPQVVDLCRPLFHNKAIIKNLFLLAIKNLEASDFAQLMNALDFRDSLPSQIGRIWDVITTGAEQPAPSKLLVKTAQAFGQDWDAVVLLRFAEFACEAEQFKLLGPPTLEWLLALASSPQAIRHTQRLLSIINAVEGFALTNLDDPGPFLLLQIHLVLKDYSGLAQQMLNQSRTFFSGDRQGDYLNVIEKLFTETPIPPTEIASALQAINQHGIKSVPFIVAAVCAIQNHPDVPKLDIVANQVSTQLFESPFLLDVIPPGVILGLIRFYCHRQSFDDAIRIAPMMAVVATHMSTHGIRPVAEAYRELSAHHKTQPGGLQMLRAYIRYQHDDETARKMIAYLIKEFGKEIRRPLEVTYLISQLMAGQDLTTFSEDVHVAVQFLQDTAALYVKRKLPAAIDLHNSLGTIPGGLNKAERRRMAEHTLAIAQAIVTLGKQYRENRPRNEEKHIEALLKLETDPKSVVDILWIVSSFFGRVRRIPIKFGSVTYPLADRTLSDVLNETSVADALLNSGVRAFPNTRPVTLTITELREELSDLRETIPPHEQAEILRGLAYDLQQLAGLIIQIENAGDAKAVGNSSLARKIDSGTYSPKSALEFYRFVYAYFFR